ncbi:MAG: hypothetical protein ACJAVS_002471 [Paracoccaceae bacterium]|jgi:hypothetical protein
MFFNDDGASLFFGWARYTIAVAEMTAEASEIIVRRTTRMAHGRMTMSEATNMVMEKATAFSASNEKAIGAAIGGAAPLAILDAALKPYGAQTRANVKRLRK